MPNNNIQQLPLEIGSLTELCALELENNNIELLPTTLGQVTNLDPNNRDVCQEARYHRGIVIEGNPLASPPPEVIDEGTGHILAYLRAEHERQKVELQRLIIAGAAGIGAMVLVIVGFWLRQRNQLPRKSKHDTT